MKDTCKLVILSLILVICILLTFLTGCKTRYITQEIPVPFEVNHTEYVNHETIKHDTLVMRDSVYHYVSGDSVIIQKWNTIYKANIMWQHDTIMKTDSIPFPVEVKKPYPVPVELTAWQKTKMDVGGFVIWCFRILSVVTIIAFVFRKQLLSFIKRK